MRMTINRLVVLFCIILLFSLGYLIQERRRQLAAIPSPLPTPSLTASTISPAPTSLASPVTSTTPSQVTPSATLPTPRSMIYYPMTRYDQRTTNRWHGKTITAADREPLHCGYPFTGFHAGDDLEVTAAELNQSVPVFAIAQGTVRQVADVDGYGGLIVIEHQLNNQTVTAYYGHVDLSRTRVQVDDTVRGGQHIADLGADCSSQTSDERKHLHFSIRRGTSIDVRGYVNTESELNQWLNPKTTLTQLGANQPE